MAKRITKKQLGVINKVCDMLSEAGLDMHTDIAPITKDFIIYTGAYLHNDSQYYDEPQNKLQ
jgi:hypothetical protein